MSLAGGLPGVRSRRSSTRGVAGRQGKPLRGALPRGLDRRPFPLGCPRSMNGPQTTPNLSRRTISVESKPTFEGQKSRTFSVELLAWVLANEMWELGSSNRENIYRPGFLASAGSSSAARAFQANLQAGRVAADVPGGYRFEVPRSAGFRYKPTGRGE